MSGQRRVGDAAAGPCQCTGGDELLDVRNINTSLGMKAMRCSTPERARAELWGYLMAYNL